MVKYRIDMSRFGTTPRVYTVLITRETEKSVWIKDRKRAKKSTTDEYFASFEEAKAALLAVQYAHIDDIRNQLERAKGVLGSIKGLKESS